jgi:endonuclease YncB( thermonuclease family)
MAAPIKTLTALAVLLLAITSVQGDEQPGDGPGAGPAPSSRPGGPAAGAVEPTAPAGDPGQPELPTVGGAGRAGPLLQTAGDGDGDSWRDTGGVEYRLGLVNTPEHDECYGSTATEERRTLTAAGFYAEVYERDRYGRSVAVVTTATGINVNVHLARHGFADDRYLERFRTENPDLARQLDEAFVAARAEQAGLWGACSSSAGPGAPASQEQPSRTSPPLPLDGACHPDYLTCVPVRGDGSGRGRANDLDCGSIGRPVTLRQGGADASRLDGDGDGSGCE